MKFLMVVLFLVLSGCSTVLVTDCTPHHLTLKGKLVQKCSETSE